LGKVGIDSRTPVGTQNVVKKVYNISAVGSDFIGSENIRLNIVHKCREPGIFVLNGNCPPSVPEEVVLHDPNGILTPSKVDGKKK
jgi:hypothetical protein